MGPFPFESANSPSNSGLRKKTVRKPSRKSYISGESSVCVENTSGEGAEICG
jgi:hypothetical protein